MAFDYELFNCYNYILLYQSKLDFMLKVICPARINIIGEHTDYSQGYVLPACIDRYVYMEIASANNWMVHALDLEESSNLKLEEKGKWSIYFIGVLKELAVLGITVTPLNISFQSDIPIGAGLSSSSAITVSFLYGLNEYFSFGLTKIELAKIAQKAEWHAGVKGGIMDQYAMLFGKTDQAILLDCLSLEHEYVSCLLPKTEWLLLNTNVKHKLSDTSYNDRKQVCHNGLDKLIEAFELYDYQALNQIDPKLFSGYVSGDECVFAQYLVRENNRVKSMIKHLESCNLEEIGQLLLSSHVGLSQEYRVSCPELDYLVQQLSSNINVYGARMIGGGFGGCTLQLVKEGRTAAVFEDLKGRYEQKFDLELTSIAFKIVGGIKVVNDF